MRKANAMRGRAVPLDPLAATPKWRQLFLRGEAAKGDRGNCKFPRAIDSADAMWLI